MENRQSSFATPSNSSPQTSVVKPNRKFFSLGRVVIGLAVILVVGIPAAFLAMLQINGISIGPPYKQSTRDDWRDKIKRGEDVPERILLMSGIKPADYRIHQLQVRVDGLTKQGKFQEGVQLLDEALVHEPNSTFALNSKAWLLATCKVDSVRNGKLALEHATKACDLDGSDNATYLDTLAAAYAETGDFDSAVKHIQSAIDLTKDGAQKKRYVARLDLYKNHKPFRET